MTDTLEAVPAEYADLLALCPWAKIQPHEWDHKSATERLTMIVGAARAALERARAEYDTTAKELVALKKEVSSLKDTPVFKLVPGNVPGTQDVAYEDETTRWDGRVVRQPFKIVRPELSPVGRAILQQMRVFDDLKRELDDLKASTEHPCSVETSGQRRKK